MRYWWVNQKQTYRHEVPGNYMWSPKRNQAGKQNRSYDLMRSIRPGDIVFSFADSHIKAVGVVGSYCYEFPKPTEFGNAGAYWSNVGWRADVNFHELRSPIKPKEHINQLINILPAKYSPLQPNGDGNQAYLFDISKEFALALARLIDRTIVDLVRGERIHEEPDLDLANKNIKQWEDAVEKSIKQDDNLSDTVRETLVNSRIGQGDFRRKLLLIEPMCRITKVNNPTHLVASHTKPWRDCTNEERLDPENGFMLTPTIDHLFDRGFISFDNNGELIISNVTDPESLIKMGINYDDRLNVGKFTEGQRHYLEWHRDSILLSH